MKPTTPTLVTAAVACALLLVAAGVLVDSRSPPRFGRFGAPLDVAPVSVAAQAITAVPAARDRRVLRAISSQPTSTWITGSTATVAATVAETVDGAATRDSIATLVAYDIPGRDCGGYSASEENVDDAAYRAWVREFAAGLGDAPSIIILEPDALAQLDCLEERALAARLALLRYAVDTFTARGAIVYLDAGHSGWHPAGEMAGRLERAGIASAAGFSLNVSNFGSTSSEIAYGTAISKKLDSAPHFVVDTSRNGGSVADGEWCNPGGAALGERPTYATASDLVDAYLWVKTPGLSDGQCNGGPAAGQWWTKYALDLAKNSPVSGP